MERLDREARSRQAPDGLVVTKILATQRAITVGAVMAEIRRIFRRRPAIVLGASPNGSLQGRNLSLASRVWPELDDVTLTTFPAGINATLSDLRLETGRTAPQPFSGAREPDPAQPSQGSIS